MLVHNFRPSWYLAHYQIPETSHEQCVHTARKPTTFEMIPRDLYFSSAPSPEDEPDDAPRTVPSTVRSCVEIARLTEVNLFTQHTTKLIFSHDHNAHATNETPTRGDPAEEEDFRPYIVDDGCVELLAKPAVRANEERVGRDHGSIAGKSRGR